MIRRNLKKIYRNFQESITISHRKDDGCEIWLEIRFYKRLVIAFGGKRTFRMTNDCAAENISKKQRGVPTVQNNKNPFFEPRNNRGNGTNFSCLLFLSLFIFFPFTIFCHGLFFHTKPPRLSARKADNFD